MCCFSSEVDSVSATRIFARFADAASQYVVYSMTIASKVETAMILPLPVAPASGEEALKFISLEKYANFFDDLESGFPIPPPPASAVDRSIAPKLAPLEAPLKVVSVGKFEASFVPTVKDFSRLDERFKLPSGTWEKLGDYAKFGFAVFKLKSGEQTVHPMAFSFPTALRGTLFFPTVHVHDGKVHGTADFDHTLYAQPDHLRSGANWMKWRESPRLAGAFMKADKTERIINEKAHAYRQTLRGRMKNVDTLV